MKKVLVTYFTTSGKTEEMANYIAEGVRFEHLQAIVKKMNELKSSEEIKGYDGYIFGSPTISLDIPNYVKSFLKLLKEIDLENKLCGAFGPYLHDASYQHSNHAPVLILNIMQSEHKMNAIELGALTLKEYILDTREGIKACQEYGRIFTQKLNKTGQV
jgi:flavodoxin